MIETEIVIVDSVVSNTLFYISFSVLFFKTSKGRLRKKPSLSSSQISGKKLFNYKTLRHKKSNLQRIKRKDESLLL